MKERFGCCSIGYTGTPGDGGHIRPSAMHTFSWLPKGYGQSMDDRLVCVLFDPGDKIKHPLPNGERHPLMAAISDAIADYFKKNPDAVTGTFENRS